MKKEKYSIFSNVSFIMRNVYQWDKRIILLALFFIPSAVLTRLIDVYIPATIVELATGRRERLLIIAVAVFALVKVAVTLTMQYSESMKPKLDNHVFHEWIDAMIACQEDKTLKTTLTPIISKLSDMRVVSAELDYMMYEPLKEFITMVLLLVGNIPMIYFLNRGWYLVLIGTGMGKAIMAVCGVVIFVSLAAVIRLTKPIDYKR